MRWISPSPSSQPNRLSRAIVSGFVATVVMTLTFFAAYGLALFLAPIESVLYERGELLGRWVGSLTHNPAIELASNSFFVAVAVHFAIGLMWAVIYVYFAEPRLAGPGWQRGVMFSTMPWILSLVVFLPLMGGGPFGLATGAGPLPTLGNLILHVAYGSTLGMMYGLFGRERGIEEGDMCRVDMVVELRSQRFAATGILVGTVIGAAVGAMGVYFFQLLPGGMALGIPPVFFLSASMLMGGSWGGVVGSLSGLTFKADEAAGMPAMSPGQTGYVEGPQRWVLRWEGAISPASWAQLYDEVLSRLPSQGALRLEMKLEASLPASVPKERVADMQERFRLLGLSDKVVFET